MKFEQPDIDLKYIYGFVFKSMVSDTKFSKSVINMMYAC